MNLPYSKAARVQGVRGGAGSRGLLVAVLLVVASVGLSSPAAAAVEPRGLWEGTTSQDRPIRFKVNAHRTIASAEIVTVVRIDLCTATITLTATHLSIPVRADDTFRIRLVHSGAHVVVTGEFLGHRRASGRFETDYEGTCGAGHKKGIWTATRQ